METQQKKEMSFLRHLEELRWHLIRIFIVIFLVAVVLFIFQRQVYEDFLLAHLKPYFPTYQFFCKAFSYLGINSDFCNLQFNQKLQSLAPTQQLMSALWTSIIFGIIISFPYILWEFWRFIAPGLYPSEIKKSKGFIVISSLLFFLGALFSYFVIIPMSIYFFYNYSITTMIQNNFRMESYISLVTNSILGVAIFFELPVVIYFLSKIGLVTPQFLKKYRKHALVVVLVLAAIITPPDVASQIIVSIPILILYEISIYVSRSVIKKQAKNESQSKEI